MSMFRGSHWFIKFLRIFSLLSVVPSLKTLKEFININQGMEKQGAENHHSEDDTSDMIESLLLSDSEESFKKTTHIIKNAQNTPTEAKPTPEAKGDPHIFTTSSQAQDNQNPQAIRTSPSLDVPQIQNKTLHSQKDLSSEDHDIESLVISYSPTPKIPTRIESDDEGSSLDSPVFEYRPSQLQNGQIPRNSTSNVEFLPLSRKVSNASNQLNQDTRFEEQKSPTPLAHSTIHQESHQKDPIQRILTQNQSEKVSNTADPSLSNWDSSSDNLSASSHSLADPISPIIPPKSPATRATDTRVFVPPSKNLPPITTDNKLKDTDGDIIASLSSENSFEKVIEMEDTPTTARPMYKEDLAAYLKVPISLIEVKEPSVSSQKGESKKQIVENISESSSPWDSDVEEEERVVEQETKKTLKNIEANLTPSENLPSEDKKLGNSPLQPNNNASKDKFDNIEASYLRSAISKSREDKDLSPDSSIMSLDAPSMDMDHTSLAELDKKKTIQSNETGGSVKSHLSSQEGIPKAPSDMTLHLSRRSLQERFRSDFPSHEELEKEEKQAETEDEEEIVKAKTTRQQSAVSQETSLKTSVMMSNVSDTSEESVKVEAVEVSELEKTYQDEAEKKEKQDTESDKSDTKEHGVHSLPNMRNNTKDTIQTEEAIETKTKSIELNPSKTSTPEELQPQSKQPIREKSCPSSSSMTGASMEKQRSLGYPNPKKIDLEKSLTKLTRLPYSSTERVNPPGMDLTSRQRGKSDSTQALYRLLSSSEHSIHKQFSEKYDKKRSSVASGATTTFGRKFSNIEDLGDGGQSIEMGKLIQELKQMSVYCASENSSLAVQNAVSQLAKVYQERQQYFKQKQQTIMKQLEKRGIKF